jgi:hypothetical protein
MIIVDPKERTDFTHTRQVLNRSHVVEHQMLRTLAGCLPACPRLEIKMTMVRLL